MGPPRWFRVSSYEAEIAELERRLSAYEGPGRFYLFALTEGGLDADGLGPTYRMIPNRDDFDGQWTAEDGLDAIKQSGHEGIIAFSRVQAVTIVRYPEI